MFCAIIYVGLAERARDLAIERIYRGTRCGRFHPANAMTVHEVVGKSALGVLGHAGPRWG